MRYVLLIAVAAAVVWHKGRLGGIGSAGEAATLTALATILMVLPLYAFQVGIALTAPLTANVLRALGPVFVFALAAVRRPLDLFDADADRHPGLFRRRDREQCGARPKRSGGQSETAASAPGACGCGELTARGAEIQNVCDPCRRVCRSKRRACRAPA